MIFYLKYDEMIIYRGASYTGSTHASGACRLGSIPSAPTGKILVRGGSPSSRAELATGYKDLVGVSPFG